MHKAAKCWWMNSTVSFPQSVEGVCELQALDAHSGGYFYPISRGVQAAILDAM